MPIVLRRISAAAGEALRAGQLPTDVEVAADYPTEFSFGVGRHAGNAGALGPFFLHRADDDVVVGEIGGGVVAPGVVEIGYAVVTSCWGRGYATEAVRALVQRAREVADIGRVVGTHAARSARERKGAREGGVRAGGARARRARGNGHPGPSLGARPLGMRICGADIAFVAIMTLRARGGNLGTTATLGPRSPVGPALNRNQN